MVIKFRDKSNKLISDRLQPAAMTHCFLIFAAFLLINLWSNVRAHITYIEVRLPLDGERALPGSPWPLPREWNSTNEVLTLDPEQFVFDFNGKQCDIIENAVTRYRTYIFSGGVEGKLDSSLSVLRKVRIHVENETCAYPKMDEDESYDIYVEEDGATMYSRTVWGALRGLETFSQLIYQDEKTKNYLINVTAINDWPRYKYRGILLDTARHFQPLSVLKQNLDAMAYNKFNVFHWHLVDDQSFPFESKIYPNLTTMGAYSMKHVYTQEDVKEIIEYARLRGIRVIPEIDTPGHTQAIGKAYPQLLTPCYGEGPDKPFTANHPEHASAEILNPMENFTYDFFKSLFEEVKTLFPDEYIHLGMDEVYYACWKSNPDINKFMEERNISSFVELENYYVGRTLGNVKDIGYKYMIWQDPIDSGVVADKETIVQVWKDTNLDSKLGLWQDSIPKIAKKGYRVILSACWYLNYISYGQDWKKYYMCDPRGFEGTEEEKDLVIGGEACLWSEYLDGTNLLSRLWPRASAVAERLWSSETVNDTETAQFRLDEHRCRMLRRGIPAQPILNGFCGDYEWGMLELEDRELTTPRPPATCPDYIETTTKGGVDAVSTTFCLLCFAILIRMLNVLK